MGMLDEGAEMLASELSCATAIDVLYFEGEHDESVPIKATRGKSSYDVTDANGYMTRIQSDDFLIVAADIVFEPEVPHEPKDGDYIRLTNQYGDYEYYTVLCPAPTVNHYQKVDSGGVVLRVHTKLDDQT